jgi:hypothetical protein
MFMRHLKTVLEELEIVYTMPVQPILVPTNGPPPSMSPVQTPLSGFQGPNPDLGNAGRFYPPDISYVPGRSYRNGIPVVRPPPAV